MKRILIFSFFAFIFLTSCKDKKNVESNDTTTAIESKEEIEEMESLTKELDQSAEELDQKAKELEKALEEIDN